MTRKNLSNRAKGIILCLTLIVCSATAGLWTYTPESSKVTEASSCQTIFLGRGGTVNTCQRIPDDKVAKNIRRGVGSTATGCTLGFASGGLVGAMWGCLGGLFSNIPWAGW